MTAPAWKGPTVTGICDECGHVAEIKDPNALRAPHKHETGYCPACGGMVAWTVWRGPVMPRG